MKRITILAALFSTSCALIYDGHDIPTGPHADAGTPFEGYDAGTDAGTPLGGPCDADGDGYQRAGCTTTNIDCDDSDPNVSPWPPHVLPRWVDDVSSRTTSRVKVAAISAQCGLVAYLDSSTTPARLVAEGIGDATQCPSAIAWTPDRISCGTGTFDTIEAFDLRAPSWIPIYTIAGTCGGEHRIRVMSGDPVTGTLLFDTALPTSDPVRSVQHLDTIDGALVMSSTGEVDFVNALTSFSINSGATWLAAAGAVGLSDTATATRVMYLRDRTTPGADWGAAQGRGAVLYFSDANSYRLALLETSESVGVLYTVGPFEESQPVGNVSAVGWSDQPLPFDPMLAGTVLANDVFLVAGRNAHSIDVQRGHYEGFNDNDAYYQRAAISLPIPESALADDVRDLAIAEASDGNRSAVFLATAVQHIHSTRFEVCNETP